MKQSTIINKSIALTILTQLGGNQFIAMTGSKNFVSGSNWLQMELAGNLAKAKFLRISLTPADTYDLLFYSFDKSFNSISRAVFTGVYADQLQTIFTNITGLETAF